MEAKLGICGGTGFYHLADFKKVKWITLNTPFGKPSDDFIIYEKGGKEIVFIPRHGHGHTILPHNVNHRANIHGLKQLGVTHVISISTVGSFREEIEPGTIVFIDQYLDRTKEHFHDTFFDRELVVHISFADPVCSCMHSQFIEIAEKKKVKYTASGTYVNMQGPAFSTRAESRLYRSWGMAVIGMTSMYEARLCREAELHFGAIAQVTDYDSWKEEAVDVATILGNLNKTAASVGQIISNFIEQFPFPGCSCNCHNALKGAIVSDISKLTPALKRRYALLIAKYLS